MAIDPRRLMRIASMASMTVAVILIGAKAAAWLITESVSMLSSLIDSSLDLIASIVTFVAVRHALTPADADHRFGHGKAEALSGLAQAGFIAASGGGLLLTVGERIFHPHEVQNEMAGLGVSALAVALTLGLVLFQSYVVRKSGSIAIGADRTHYFTDLVTNVAVGIAIFASAYTRQPLIDLVVAAGIALYLLHSAWQVSKASLDVLMDRELAEKERRRIVDIARAHAEVRGVHDLRTRSSGLTKFIQLHVELDPGFPLIKAHEIGDEVEAEIQKFFPDAEIILHVDPFGVEERRARFA